MPDEPGVCKSFSWNRITGVETGKTGKCPGLSDFSAFSPFSHNFFTKSTKSSTNATFVLVQISVAVNVGFHFVFPHKSVSLVFKCVPRYFGARPKNNNQPPKAKGRKGHGKFHLKAKIEF